MEEIQIHSRNVYENCEKAVLQCYVQTRSKKLTMPPRPAVVIFPGGGYDYTSDREAEPVANAYLAAQGSALRAADITGVTGQGLLQYLRGGDPVIVWITKDLSAPRTGGCTWLLADTGETYVPYVNLHCVVLAGWDGDTCTIADPLQGRRRVDAAAFLQCFRQMGSRAVVVH